jgi:hypothetical protein
MSPIQISDGDVCGEIITIYSGKHTKHINVFCEQNAHFINVRTVVQTATTVF